MEFNTEHLDRYVADLEQARENLARTRQHIDYLRLQIKQTKQHMRDAKRHAAMQQFAALVPADYYDVCPHPGGLVIDVHLAPLAWSLYGDIPQRMAMQHVDTQPGARHVTVHQYRVPGGLSFYFHQHHV